MSKTEKKDAEKAKIAAAEASLIAKYGDKVVKGSVRRAKKQAEKKTEEAKAESPEDKQARLAAAEGK